MEPLLVVEPGRARVDCGGKMKKVSYVDCTKECGCWFARVRLTSERVLRSVNGIRTKPTPVRAELPTIKSPAGVNFALPPKPGPAALNLADLAT